MLWDWLDIEYARLAVLQLTLTIASKDLFLMKLYQYFRTMYSYHMYEFMRVGIHISYNLTN